ncbi:aldehyde dehydrogenase family protein [Spongiibacter taiwanensis]|uniref:aldehyde dehydrogenase family protein n=1 Tax=Spongiibacter taiwanensis TaxID=1748242 RepID=UPI0020363148|nr:aldehyde dehydrogenase family protein [Spongiibacter taiwanensis]USA42435.1 aldehyde dehydrogenase family protein [Spongiibacter taiwanensis]
MSYKLLIDGQLVDGAGHIDVINPADETVIAASPIADEALLNAAVAAAKRAQPGWAATPLQERAACLSALAEAAVAHEAELAKLVTLEVGRPLPLAHFELQLVQKSCSFYSQQSLAPEVLHDDEATRIELQRLPLGVVAAILPWNAPLYLAINKLAPAVLAGNCVVLKPAPTSPLSTLKFGELLAKIFPPGVVNIIADRNDLGAALVNHPDIAKVAFTGSTATGMKILQSAAANLKKVTLELSGNDAAILLPDVDIAAIAGDVIFGAFFNSAQICAVIKRLYVHESRYDEICDVLAAGLSQAVMGNGMDPDVMFGPIQNAAQYDKVKGFLEEARETGTIICGGEIPEGKGYFITPTLVRDLSDGHRLVDEEPFGPILPIIKYRDIDDAVARANASPLGLGGSVWSADAEQARAVAERLQAGTVWVNQHCAIDPAIPFPTSKGSGLGVEAGREGLLEYCNLRVMNIKK